MCDEIGEKMCNEKWSLKDRVFQLKMIVDLYDENKKWTEGITKETAKRRTKEIRELESTERDIREAVQTFKEGDTEGINVLLKQDPGLESLCKGKSIQECDEIARQMIFLKRREYDNLIFELQQKEEEFLQNQYKLEMLKIPSKMDVQKSSFVYRAQDIEAEIENTMTKQEAAVIVRDSYDKIRKILKKDSQCFDRILGALQLDMIIQCQCVIKAIELGQAAIEEEAALREKLNKINKEFKEKLSQRNQQISLIKKRIANARNVHQKLQKSESFTKLLANSNLNRLGDSYTKKLMIEFTGLQDIMNKLKDTCQVSDTNKIFSSAEIIAEKKFRLMRQIEINRIWLKTELIRMNHIHAMNEKIILCVTDQAKKWISDRFEYEREIPKLEKVREMLKNELKQEARIMGEIQTELTHLQRIVDPVKVGAFKMEVLDNNLQTIHRRVDRIGNSHTHLDTGPVYNSAHDFLDVQQPDYAENQDVDLDDSRPAVLSEICQILDVISAKIDIIKTQIGDTEDKHGLSEDYYNDYMDDRARVFQLNLPKFDRKSDEDSNSAVKPKLLTREEMKEKSKRLVSIITEKPKPLTGTALFNIKKHSCY